MKGRITLRRFDTKQIVAQNHNVVLYSAADIIARVVGGDTSYIPTHIGFIYADKNYTGFTVPTDSDRHYTWEHIKEEVRDSGGNMIASQLTTERGYRASDNNYSGNILTISAITDRSSDLVFSGPGFTDLPPIPGSDAYFQTVFMVQRFREGSVVPEYTPYAYASINADGSGVEVISNAEYQQHWDITIK